ncbi:2-dehydro-3-deoxygluconokinase [Polycladomyces abyssicola]|uniref:2-dehydro-3-deoxygluconokinase n=1 Tax=Polycladomyces abyssicola TaxID=1125966 RepID=A0A8D5ZN41_9BACL|nr:sugar kinase [Polycladomyces abyssicola]BCU81572.1 2-dehydro-3-deoxygluconokinase [Polycladomyces abyssicola]
MKLDVVTLGETMVLLVPTSVGPLRYAGQFEKTIGGAESNMAIGLARLGHQVGWISRLGNDEFGLYVRNFIRGEGVDTSRVIFDDLHPTAVFFKERQLGQEPRIYYYRKGSAASCMTPEDLDESYITQAQFLYITGITPALSASCEATVDRAIELARRNGLTVVFDPNIRLKLWSKEEARRVLIDVASRCDIVMPGFEEGEILTGEQTPEKIAACLLANGARVVVVKLGERGAYFATPEQSEYVEGFPVKQIVDPIGAGDAFAAGFLSGLLRGWTYREAVRLGNRTGAYALTVAGDVEGLPFWSQIEPQKSGNQVTR